MTSAGKVPGGRVDDGLLRQDAAAPFGVRLDPDRVETRLHRRVAAGLGRAGRGLRPRARRHPGAVRVRRAGGEDARPRARGHRPHRRPAARPRRPSDMVMVVGPTPPQERDALSVAAVRGARLRARAAALDHDAARRLRQPRRRRADRPHVLRARPARRDGRPAHGDRRGRAARSPTHRAVPRRTSTRTASSATASSARR